MLEKKKILFIVEDAIHLSDGYKTRIEMEMDILGDEYNYSLLAPMSKSDVNPIQFKHNVNIITYKAFNSKIPFIFNTFKLRKALCKILKREKMLVIAEALPSAVMSYKMSKKKGCKFIYDCHGTAPDEILMNGNSIMRKIYANFLRHNEIKIVNGADLSVAVSDNQYIKWGIENEFCKLPMLPGKHFMEVGNAREEMREKLGIGEKDLVFVYSGQNQVWQMSEETIKYYKSLEIINKDSFLLILTHQTEAFERLALENHLNRYKIISVQYNDVPIYLDACDFGFCLRKNHIVNLVSSPTKVLEYMARNVKPILTEYVGDFSNELVKKDMAIVINNFKPQSFFKELSYDGKGYVKSKSLDFINAYTKKIESMF